MKETRQYETKHPKNAVSGLYYGISTFSKDCYHGVTGVVTEPVKVPRLEALRVLSKELERES